MKVPTQAAYETTAGQAGADADVPPGGDLRVGAARSQAVTRAVPPGTDVGTLDQAYLPPAMLDPSLRRRPVTDRSAA
jgi:hypothetical protein